MKTSRGTGSAPWQHETRGSAKAPAGHHGSSTEPSPNTTKLSLPFPHRNGLSCCPGREATVSIHMPKDIVDVIHKQLRDHKDKNHARLASVLRVLTDKMKADPTARARKFVEHYLDEELRKITS